MLRCRKNLYDLSYKLYMMKHNIIYMLLCLRGFPLNWDVVVQIVHIEIKFKYQNIQ
jgi:hypothetical protein